MYTFNKARRVHRKGCFWPLELGLNQNLKEKTEKSPFKMFDFHSSSYNEVGCRLDKACTKLFQIPFIPCL